jgi:hypothetical protein
LESLEPVVCCRAFCSELSPCGLWEPHGSAQRDHMSVWTVYREVQRH